MADKGVMTKGEGRPLERTRRNDAVDERNTV